MYDNRYSVFRRWFLRVLGYVGIVPVLMATHPVTVVVHVNWNGVGSEGCNKPIVQKCPPPYYTSKADFSGYALSDTYTAAIGEMNSGDSLRVIIQGGGSLTYADSACVTVGGADGVPQTLDLYITANGGTGQQATPPASQCLYLSVYNGNAFPVSYQLTGSGGYVWASGSTGSGKTSQIEMQNGGGTREETILQVTDTQGNLVSLQQVPTNHPAWGDCGGGPPPQNPYNTEEFMPDTNTYMEVGFELPPLPEIGGTNADWATERTLRAFMADAHSVNVQGFGQVLSGLKTITQNQSLQNANAVSSYNKLAEIKTDTAAMKAQGDAAASARATANVYLQGLHEKAIAANQYLSDANAKLLNVVGSSQTAATKLTSIDSSAGTLVTKSDAIKASTDAVKVSVDDVAQKVFEAKNSIITMGNQTAANVLTARDGIVGQLEEMQVADGVNWNNLYQGQIGQNAHLATIAGNTGSSGAIVGGLNNLGIATGTTHEKLDILRNSIDQGNNRQVLDLGVLADKANTGNQHLSDISGKLTTANSTLTSMDGKLTVANGHLFNSYGQQVTANQHLELIRAAVVSGDGKLSTLIELATAAGIARDDIGAAIGSVDANISTSNVKLDGLGQKLEVANGHLSAIAQNTEDTAAEAQRTADNVEALDGHLQEALTDLGATMSMIEDNTAGLPQMADDMVLGMSGIQDSVDAFHDSFKAMTNEMMKGTISGWIGAESVNEMRTFGEATAAEGQGQLDDAIGQVGTASEEVGSPSGLVLQLPLLGTINCDPMAHVWSANLANAFKATVLWVTYLVFFLACWRKGEEYALNAALVPQYRLPNVTTWGTNWIIAAKLIMKSLLVPLIAALWVVFALVLSWATGNGSGLGGLSSLVGENPLGNWSALAATVHLVNCFFPVMPMLSCLSLYVVFRLTVAKVYWLAQTLMRAYGW